MAVIDNPLFTRAQMALHNGTDGLHPEGALA